MRFGGYETCGDGRDRNIGGIEEHFMGVTISYYYNINQSILLLYMIYINTYLEFTLHSRNTRSTNPLDK